MMSREYIERDELLIKINENPAEQANERCAQLIEAILEAPAADVVAVVRCGKCRYREPVVEGGKVFYVCNNINTVLVEVKPNEYCSYGERKDGVDDEAD